MKVFLDDCVDWRLSREIAGHEVRTARQMGKNGELLALASQQFDVFVTVDRNIGFQQNLTALTITVLILRAPTNRLADLRRLVPNLLTAIADAKPGSAAIAISA